MTVKPFAPGPAERSGGRSTADTTRVPKAPGAGEGHGPRFDEVLRRVSQPTAAPQAGQISGGVRFSAHAQERLAAGNIRLSQGQLNRLTEAVGRAAAKGARDALILLGDVALVVSIKNRTVVTAIDKPRLTENVFTNIDSAVIT